MRAVEILYAVDEALRLLAAYVPPDPPAIDVPPRAATGYGWSEAPRGLLWHRYAIDAEGTILDARIVPPTSQNQARIEQSLRGFVERHLALADEELQPPLRAGRAQLRPLHLVRDPLPEARDRPLVIGVGNAWRRDDGAGPAVAAALGGPCTDDPSRLLDLWAGAEHAIVVDAAASGAPPGTIRRFDADAGAAPGRRARARRTRSASPTPSSSRARSAASRRGSRSTRSRARTSARGRAHPAVARRSTHSAASCPYAR